MADDPNEESWLYGSNTNPDQPADSVDSPTAATKSQTNPDADQNDPEITEDDPFAEVEIPGNGGVVIDDPFVRSTDGIGDEEEEEEVAERKDADFARDTKKDDIDDDDVDGENNSHYSDEDDDDINVVIGDIKSGSSYNIKQRPPLLGPGGTTVVPEKFKQAPGKFSIDEFECVGTISGVPAHEFSIDSLDEKPWRKPGADITDYFNYGFNEDTWRAYCERQKQMRMNESGVGLQGLSAGLPPPQRMMEPRGDRMMGGDRGGGMGGQDRRDDMGPSRGYQGGDGNNMPGGFIRRAGPPPGRKPNMVQIDVIGGNTNNMSRRDQDMMQGASIPTKENMIQVMTAERREYSRIQGAFPPNEPFFEPEPNYNYGYEPTQEQQWNNDQPAWTPTGIKELTSGPPMVPPPQMHVLRGGPSVGAGSSQMVTGGRGDRDRDRGGDRGGDRSERSDRERDRDRAERGARDHGVDRSRDRVKSEDRRDRGNGAAADRGDRSSRREASTRDRAERSRSREGRRRRSKSRDKDRKSRDRKKSHKKEKEIKEERLSD